jgi:H+/Cl- antiporter ClcA
VQKRNLKKLYKKAKKKTGPFYLNSLKKHNREFWLLILSIIISSTVSGITAIFISKIYINSKSFLDLTFGGILMSFTILSLIFAGILFFLIGCYLFHLVVIFIDLLLKKAENKK